jgi:hypothetical protein
MMALLRIILFPVILFAFAGAFVLHEIFYTDAQKDYNIRPME